MANNFKFQLSLDIKPYSESLKVALQMAKNASVDIRRILQGLDPEIDTKQFDKQIEDLEKQLQTMSGEDVEVPISANSAQVEQTIKDVDKTVQKTKKKSEKPFVFKGDAKDILNEFAKIGLAIDGVKKVAGMIQSASNPFVKYESGLKNLNTLINVTDEELAQHGETLKELSAITNDLKAVNNGAWLAVSKLGEEVLANTQFMEDMAKSSVAGKASIEESISLTANIIKSMDLELSDSQMIMDQVFSTVKYGDTNFKDLANNIGGVSPMAKSAGVQLNELNSLYATLTGTTGNTSEVTTQLRAMLSNIVKPSAQATEMARSLGIQFDVNAVKTKGFIGFLEDLKTATNGDIEVLGKLFESTEALNAVTALTSTQFDTFNSKLDLISDSSGAMTTAFDEQTDTLEYKQQQLKNSLELLSISLIEKLAPAITSIVEGTAKAIDVFSENRALFTVLIATIATYTLTTKLALAATSATTAGITTQVYATAALKASWLKLNTVMKANPIMAILAVEIAVVTTALMKLKSHLNKELESQRELTKQINEKTKARAKEIAHIEKYSKTFQDASKVELVAESKKLDVFILSSEANRDKEIARLKQLDASKEKIQEVTAFYDADIQAAMLQQQELIKLYEAIENISPTPKKDVSYEQWLDEVKQKQDETFNKGFDFVETNVGLNIEDASLDELKFVLENIQNEEAKIAIQMQIENLEETQSELDEMIARIQQKAIQQAEEEKQLREKKKQDLSVYYEAVKFEDENYFEWKKSELYSEVDAMDISESQKVALKAQNLEELRQQEQAYNEQKQADFTVYMEAMKFEEEDYFNWKVEQINAEVEAMKLGEDEKEAYKKQKIDALANAQKQADAKARKAGVKDAIMKLQAAKSYFSDISGLMNAYQGKSRALFNIGKAASLASATINTAQAVTKALAAYPFPLNVAPAAAAGLMGAAEISTIAATGYELGGKIEDKDLLKNSPLIPQSEDGLIAVQREEIVVSNKRDTANDDLILDMNKGKSRKQIEMDILQKHIGEIQAMNDGGFVGQNPMKTFFNVDIPQLQTPVTNFIMQNTESPLLKEIAVNLGWMKGKMEENLLNQEENNTESSGKLSSEISTKEKHTENKPENLYDAPVDMNSQRDMGSLSKVEALLSEIKQTILDKQLEANTSVELDGEQIAEIITKYQDQEVNRNV
jgi:TP901 family phage tail tape measure protein